MTTRPNERKGLGWVAGGLLFLLVAGAGWVGWVWLEKPPIEMVMVGNAEKLVHEIRGVEDWAQATPAQTESIWRRENYVLDDAASWEKALHEHRQLLYASAGGELVLLMGFLLAWARRGARPYAFLGVVGVLTVVVGGGLGAALAASPRVPGGVDRMLEAVKLPAPTDGEAGRELRRAAPKLRPMVRVMPTLYRNAAKRLAKAQVYTAAAAEGVLVLFLLGGLVRVYRSAKAQEPAQAAAAA